MLRERVRHGLKRLPDGELTWKYAKGLRDMMREGRGDAVDLWGPLPRIPCPTLVVRGAESDILSAEVAKKMAERLPDGRVVEIAGAGHTVPAGWAGGVRADDPRVPRGLALGPLSLGPLTLPSPQRGEG